MIKVVYHCISIKYIHSGFSNNYNSNFDLSVFNNIFLLDLVTILEVVIFIVSVSYIHSGFCNIDKGLNI